MTKQFVQEFAYLLDSNSDGIEVISSFLNLFSTAGALVVVTV